jgi:hypothetical protein
VFIVVSVVFDVPFVVSKVVPLLVVVKKVVEKNE